MPDYFYTAIDLKGKNVKGVLKAADEPALVSQLRQQDLFLLSCAEEEEKGRAPALKARELASFNRQIGAMLSSGITLIRAIEILLQRDVSKRQKQIYEGLYKAVLSGQPLSEALQQTRGAFPDLLINMYRAAEANGTMDLTATRMADHYEREHRLRTRLKGAATYPMVLLALTVVVVILIFTLVLPNFLSLYGDGTELPAITRVVIGASRLFTEQLPLLLGGVLLFLLLLSFLRMCQPLRFWIDEKKLKLPVA
ncbi:MAG: type II secretion system F family protein, partial [Bacillota bacterium]|nr:type II secretion system F family protein [Bacillota bacterium]